MLVYFVLWRRVSSLFFAVVGDIAGEDLNILGLAKDFSDLFKRDAFRLRLSAPCPTRKVW